MRYGFGAAITWAFDTVILSIALSCSSFFATETAIALAAFISTFLHDLCSTTYMFIYMALRRKLRGAWKALKTRSGKYVILAALLGGPVGMTGYMTAINNIGAPYTAAISAFFPAVGAFLSYLILKEKMRPYQWVGLFVCLIGVAVLGYTPAEGIPGNWFVGVGGALVCVIGWGCEAVIISYGMRSVDVDDEHALLIRQTTSTITYAAIILPLMGGWADTVSIFASNALPIIALAAALGTASYLCYYKAIARIGAAKSMAINITYSAWAIPVSLLLLGTIPNARGMVCAIVIIVGAILASTDIKALFSRTGTTQDDAATPSTNATVGLH